MLVVTNINLMNKIKMIEKESKTKYVRSVIFILVLINIILVKVKTFFYRIAEIKIRMLIYLY